MGRLPGQMIVDDGYTTRENILAAADRGVDLIGGTMEGRCRGEPARRWRRAASIRLFIPEHFRLPSRDRHLHLSGGQRNFLIAPPNTIASESSASVYKARAADCRDCALRPACQPGKRGRMIVRTENAPQVAAYVAKMQTEAARAAYRWRAPVAEFTNAWLKAKLGLRQFCVRGLQKARCEVLWACLTYNIQQWFRLRWKVRQAAVPA